LSPRARIRVRDSKPDRAILDAEEAGIENVIKISYHGRKMGTLSPDIARFTYLATLDVSYNDLADLPEDLSALHYLQGFYARGNKLTVFPEQILLLPLLARLDLSENQITEIPHEIIKMDQLVSLNLEKLDLSNNQLTSLSGEIISLSGNLKELSINGSQIFADKITWLEESMPSTQIRY